MPELIVRQVHGMDVKSIGSIVFLDLEMKFWSWSPYNKCSFRCIYCSVEAQGKSKPNITPEEVGPLLDEYLKHSKNKHALCIGGPADAYPEEEREYQIMRTILPELRKRKIKFTLVTHGDMVARDIDLLKDQPNLLNIGISIPHYTNEQVRQYEPGAPSLEARIEAVYKLREAGLPVHVNLSPWVPGLSDPEWTSNQFPEDMLINVGVLSYNSQYAEQRELITFLSGRRKPSAARVFEKQFPEQAIINDAFYEAYQRIGKGPRGNLKWLLPPGSGKNFSTYLP